MSTASKRNAFLAAFLDTLRSNGIPFCILRNHRAFWHDGPSDIDMMVMPQHLELAVIFLETAASSNSYRLASLTQFDNLCLVYHAENVGYIRIDIDTALRWRTHTLLDAKTILYACVKEEDLPIPCAEHETLILLTQCAWAGKIKEAYKARLNELICKYRSQSTGFFASYLGIDQKNLLRIITNESIAEFCEILRTARIPKQRITNIANLIKRSFVRILKPPGLVIKCSGLSSEEINVISAKMELLFPSAKAAYGNTSFPKILHTIFRGGVVWTEVESNHLCTFLVRLWIGKYRYFNLTDGQIQHPASNQAAKKEIAYDFIGRILGDYVNKPH
jgi:hypothetical protein